MIRTIQCPSGEACYADECTSNGICMHMEEAYLREQYNPWTESGPRTPATDTIDMAILTDSEGMVKK